jgi:hypothetical protein
VAGGDADVEALGLGGAGGESGQEEERGERAQAKHGGGVPRGRAGVERGGWKWGGGAAGRGWLPFKERRSRLSFDVLKWPGLSSRIWLMKQGYSAWAMTMKMGAIGLVWLCGCSNLTECEEASQYLQECLNLQHGDPGEPGPDLKVCKEPARCVAQCVNGAECDVLKDAFSGFPTVVSDPLQKCFDVCDKAK